MQRARNTMYAESTKCHLCREHEMPFMQRARNTMYAESMQHHLCNQGRTKHQISYIVDFNLMSLVKYSFCYITQCMFSFFFLHLFSPACQYHDKTAKRRVQTRGSCERSRYVSWQCAHSYVRNNDLVLGNVLFCFSFVLFVC